MQPRAIETRYSGCRFRSRLEARWAVYLNAIKAKWVYEPEGFVLSDGTHYLPDFFVYRWDSDENPAARDWGYWLEVKAVAPTDAELAALHRLCVESGHKGFLAFGKFPNPTVYSISNTERAPALNEALWLTHHLPATTARWPEGMTGDQCHSAHGAARIAAAEARFEHGDRPAV